MSFLRQMAERAVPVSSAVRYLRGQGISFRYQEMLKVYRIFAHLPEVRDAYKFIPKKFRIPAKLFGKGIGFMTKDFLYEGGFTLRSKETGKTFTKPARISSDYHLSQTSVEREALKYSQEAFSNYGWEVVGFEVTGAFSRAEQIFE